MISIWEKETFFDTQDVIIAGSGFTGLWSALYLKKTHPHLKITIVDSGLIPTGASTRNAGFASFGSLSEVVHDARVMGTDKMLELVELRLKGLERIRKYFKPEIIDFEWCGGYELYDHSQSLTVEQLQHQIEYINTLLKPITAKKNTYVDVSRKIESFGFGHTQHLVVNSLEGCLHPGKLVRSLLQKVQGLGVQVFNQMEILSYEIDNGYVSIQTNHPLMLRCRQLLICTNAFAGNLISNLDIRPARGQVILTSPIKNLPWKGTFHADEGFYYFRNLGQNVLLGGARNKAFDEESTSVFDTSPLIQSSLEMYLDEIILPGRKGTYTIENRWSGIMAMGSDKLPIVKKTSEHVFCAVRMSGMGVALAPVAARIVTKMMMEEL